MVVLDVETPETRDMGQAPRRWLRRSLVVLTVVGLLAVLACLRLARSPELVTGSFRQPFELVVVGDGFEQTRYLVPPQGSRFAFSVRNEGRLAVEVSDPVPDDANVLYDVVGFQPPAEPSQGFQTGGPLTDAVTIGPGEEATVVLAFAVPRCISIVAGGGVGVESLPLQVRSLGLTTDQDVALPLPVWVRGPVEPAPDC